MDIVQKALECRVLDLIERLVARNDPLRKKSFEFDLIPESLVTLLKTNATEGKEEHTAVWLWKIFGIVVCGVASRV
jgi:hypothetical protein